MICPKCQNQIQADARFCDKCGLRLSETVQAQEIKTTALETVCKECGAVLEPESKFCKSCGASTNKTVMPVIPKNVKANSAPKTRNKKKGSVFFILFIVLIAIVGTLVILIWQKIIPVSAFITERSSKISEEMTLESDMQNSSQPEPEIKEYQETNTGTTKTDIDADALFADIDVLVEIAKSQMDTDAKIINVMDSLSSAVTAYVSKAEEAGNAAAASDRVKDAYEAYIKAVIRHKDMMNASTFSGSIYAQIMSELDTAVELGDKMAQMGYETDTFDLEIERKVFNESYREKMIDTFDEFTTRDAWSRTEAWNLMRDTVDNMFDSADMDNPLRLRYCYALAWWTQKQIETELASDTITQKEAAIKIAGLIEAMDYNPMMIEYYIQYMSAAGEDCQAVTAAYDEIVRHIDETQGIKLGRDIDLAHFWYFNDISAPADGVQDGSINGVTPENREWIRSRMEAVEFISR